MKRTHKAMLVYNWAVSFQDDDSIRYMEYHQLKKYLSRQEMLRLYKEIKRGGYYITVSNSIVHQVVGV